MKQTIFLFLVPLLIYSCTKTSQIKDSVSSDWSTPAQGTVSSLGTIYPKDYFGVIVNAADNNYINDPNTNTNNSDPTWATTYNVKYYRMAITHENWAGSNASTYQTKVLNEYADAVNSGLKVLLNVNWEVHGTLDGPKNFPNATSYSTFLSQVLDAIKAKGGSNKAAFKPALVVVENEETYDGYFNISSTTQADNYVSQLTSAAATCKNYTSFDGTRIEVTNGGINHRSVTWVAWNYWYNQNTSQAPLQSYLRFAVPRSQFYAWYPGLAVPSDVNVPAGKKTDMISKINICVYLLSKYDLITDLSYVNVHWYEPCSVMGWSNNNDSQNGTAYTQSDPVISQDNIVMNPYASTSVFEQSLTGIYSYLPSKKLVTNETGQLTLSACLTKNILDMYLPHLGSTDFKYVGWYDGDGPFYGAKALHDDNGTTGRAQRPDGKMFSSYMQSSSTTLNCATIPGTLKP